MMCQCRVAAANANHRTTADAAHSNRSIRVSRNGSLSCYRIMCSILWLKAFHRIALTAYLTVSYNISDVIQSQTAPLSGRHKLTSVLPTGVANRLIGIELRNCSGSSLWHCLAVSKNAFLCLNNLIESASFKYLVKYT